MLYLFNSRLLTHIGFWVGYYILFSLIWASPDKGYFASFYLEFILMPVRILAVYTTLYWLIPRFLAVRQYKKFVLGYAGLIAIAGLLQLQFSYYFYSQLMPELGSQFALTLSGWARSSMLVNTTVILLGALKILQMYMQLRDEVEQMHTQDAPSPEYLEVKSDRKIHRLKVSNILYLEGMGNYVTYYMEGGQKQIVYTSLKQALANLPDTFIRSHRSYVVNKRKIDSYNQEEVFIGEQIIPRGKDITDEDLLVTSSFNT